MATDADTLRAQLAHTLASSDLPGLGLPDSRGSRDAYDLGDYVLLVMTDRLEAAKGTVPFKGEVINRMATWWLDVTGDIAPTPVERILDVQALLVRRVRPLSHRIGAWTHLRGALARAYSAGLRSVGHEKLPNDLEPGAALETPFIAAIDENGSPTSADGVARYQEARELASAFFERGQQLASDRGVTLVDTVYSFGELAGGKLGTVDLLHAPDVTTYRLDGGSLHETDIIAAWRERADGAIDLDGEQPSVLLVEIARAYIELGNRFVADFSPTTGRAINRLSWSLSAAGILA